MIPGADLGSVMPPGGGSERGCTVQGHQPASGGDEDAPPQSPPPLPATKVSLQMKMNKKQEQEDPLGSIPEGPLVEILSRVLYKSLCCFKCASKPWLALCSDPELRKRCPQTLSGFFYNTTSTGLSFCNLSSQGGPPMVDPTLPFLHRRYERVEVVQCCGGLLLCKYWKSYQGRKKLRYGYAVCNPATEQWNVLPLPITVLPDPADGSPVIYDGIDEFFLAFDALNNPSRFVVFAPLTNAFGEFTQVAIFSSETQRWTSVENGLGYRIALASIPECVLLHGTMHLVSDRGTIVRMDMEGKVLGEIEMPHDMSNYASIGQSQGCLHAWLIDNDCKLWVWVLEDYGNGKWTLKHAANVSHLLDEHDKSYWMFAIHPDCNLVFLTHEDKMTVSYDMDTQKVDLICTSGEFQDAAPYIPCFFFHGTVVT